MSKQKKKTQYKELVKSKPNKNKSSGTKKNNIPLALGIILILTAIIYWSSLSNGFVNFDDDKYIQENPLINHFNLKLIFSNYILGNYQPLVMTVYTWIYSFAQFHSNAYHIVSLLFHLINTALVLFVILELTGIFEVAFIASLLFGIHPMHVESVAWISELKDLMYSCFFLASWYCYIKYVKSGFKRKLIILSLVFFLCSVLSKGMGVSLPVVLLLTDYFFGRKMEGKVFIEKIPFFILSIIFGIVAIVAQKSQGAIRDIAIFSASQRIVFACYGWVATLYKLILPFNLSAYYPYPIKGGDELQGSWYVYPVLVIALFAIVFYSLKKTNKIFFTIGFFTVTIALVLQLITVGGAVMADRYSYISSIGIFLLFAYALYALYKRPIYRTLAMGLLIVITSAYSILAYQRTLVWKNGMTLWSDVIEKGEVSIAYYNRGGLYRQSGKIEEAINDYTKAIELNAYDENTYNNLGSAYLALGRNEESINILDRAIQLNPKRAEPYHNRGMANFNLRRIGEACKDFLKAEELGDTMDAKKVDFLCK